MKDKSKNFFLSIGIIFFCAACQSVDTTSKDAFPVHSYNFVQGLDSLNPHFILKKTIGINQRQRDSIVQNGAINWKKELTFLSKINFTKLTFEPDLSTKTANGYLHFFVHAGDTLIEKVINDKLIQLDYSTQLENLLQQTNKKTTVSLKNDAEDLSAISYVFETTQTFKFNKSTKTTFQLEAQGLPLKVAQ